jgi:hypothetical protein
MYMNGIGLPWKLQNNCDIYIYIYILCIQSFGESCGTYGGETCLLLLHLPRKHNINLHAVSSRSRPGRGGGDLRRDMCEVPQPAGLCYACHATCSHGLP